MVKSSLFRAALRLALGCSLFLGGCGYHWGYVRPPGVQTVGVAVFENETFRRGVELQLTELISEEIATKTGFLLDSPEKADAVIKGKVLDVYDAPILSGPNNEIRDVSVWISVKAEFVERRTGKVLATTTLVDRAYFLTDSGQSRQTATQKTSSRLAEKIVYNLSYVAAK